MRHGVGNKSAEQEENFEVLGQVYLDPVLKEHSPSWIAIVERGTNTMLQRVCRGTQSKQTTGRILEQVVFQKEILGHIDVEQNSFASSLTTAIKRQISDLARELAPLFAWKNVPWATRLSVLEVLYKLRRKNSDFDWVGIYRLDDRYPGEVVLSAYMGDPTDHLRIPISHGICGAAIRESKTINVPNVKADPRFIACSLSTQSELVVPIRNSKRKAVAEIDIDSNRLNAFPPERIAEVEACASKIEAMKDFVESV